MTTKPCNKCFAVKPLNQFPAHPHMRDGHINMCGKCKDSEQRKREAHRLALSKAARAVPRVNDLWSRPVYQPGIDNQIRQDRAAVCVSQKEPRMTRGNRESRPGKETTAIMDKSII